jgi:hypothetical protein
VSVGCLFLTFAILVLPRLAVMLGLLK